MLCRPKRLPDHLAEQAARTAALINPLNHAPLHRLTELAIVVPDKAYIALTTRYWRNHGVHLSVSFLDGGEAALQDRILSHMNAWGTRCNVVFSPTSETGDVRITRDPDDGCWSYIGTDIGLIAADQPTMNLGDLTMESPEEDFCRIARHEAGHTLGCPHEHLRREFVDRIDPDKAIAYFANEYGWSEDKTRSQVLTPIEESSLIGPAHCDPNSIMCYQIPGDITYDGLPIPGGTDIDEQDFAFLATIYPKVLT
jgi:hypothetical protein